jgi:hypothetical protein
MTTDPFTKRLLGLGRDYDKMMGRASIERCNCMVRYGDGPQIPAVKRGKVFSNPEGDEITNPTSYEMMHHTAIARILNCRNEIYIGHMFK